MHRAGHRPFGHHSLLDELSSSKAKEQQDALVEATADSGVRASLRGPQPKGAADLGSSAPAKLERLRLQVW